MTSELKPIKLWGRGGPNPPKVAIILKELSLPHEIISVPLSEVKKPEYLAINPNGRIPAIYDPNTDITLWESGAIILYLIERYDKEHKLSFAPGTAEAYHAQQWLFFQVSGQGPYYGQLAWFKKFHHENLPSAIERYTKELHRVSGVLNGHLEKQKKAHGEGEGPWLVGNRISYADLAFYSYQFIVVTRFSGEDFNADEYPFVKEWTDNMAKRQAVAEVMADVFTH